MAYHGREKIYVNTPNGKKFHGDIVTSKTGKKFVRRLDPFKDKIRIFDAYSINPDALREIIKQRVPKIVFTEKGSGRRKPLVITTDDLCKMLNGELTQDGKRLAWEAEFAGGQTIYIKVVAFNHQYLNKQEKLL